MFFDAMSMQTRVVPVKPTEWAEIAERNTRIDRLVEYEQAACDLDLATQYGPSTVKVDSL